jgi:hypothetical protein
MLQKYSNRVTQLHIVFAGISIHTLIILGINKGKGSLDNGYLDNLDNEFSNKYEKLLKIEKNIIDMFFYL